MPCDRHEQLPVTPNNKVCSGQNRQLPPAQQEPLEHSAVLNPGHAQYPIPRVLSYSGCWCPRQHRVCFPRCPGPWKGLPHLATASAVTSAILSGGGFAEEGGNLSARDKHPPSLSYPVTH